MLPIAIPSVEDSKPIAAPVQMHDPPIRILLVDDSADSRFLICAYLKMMRCIIVEAVNGCDAIENFIAGKFDVVLLDLKMPFMDGYEACKQIRAWERESHRPRTPIVAITAYAFDYEMRCAYEAGCDAHVTKPFRKATLLAAISAATLQATETATADGAPPA
jgi:CheY-like chemotaxis protein